MSSKGYKHKPEAIERIRASSLLRRHTKESKKRMSEVQTGIPKSEAHKEKLRQANLGKKQSEETKAKHSATSTGVPKPSGFGEACSKRQLEKNGTGDYKDPRESKKYKEFRKIVLTRENYICQECGDTEEESKEKQRQEGKEGKGVKGLHVHHIKDWKNYPELRFVPRNGKAYCVVCHGIEEQRLIAEQKLLAEKKQKLPIRPITGR